MKKINISVYHEDVFTHNPLTYSEADVHECLDIDLGKINQSRLLQVIRECYTFPVVSLYYCAPKKDLSKHLKPLRNHDELAYIIKTAFDNGGNVDFFVQHHGYDVIAEGVFKILFSNTLVDGKYIRNEDVDVNLGRNCTTLRVDEVEDNGVDDIFKVKEDIDLGKINQSRLLEVIRECYTFPVVSLYYCAPKKDLSKYLKPLRNHDELAYIIKTAFDNRDEEIKEIKFEDISEYVGLEHVDGKYIRNEDVDSNLGRNCTTLRVDEVEDNGVDDIFKVKEG
nr:splicing factor [Tanacetum cinerariifolium]